MGKARSLCGISAHSWIETHLSCPEIRLRTALYSFKCSKDNMYYRVPPRSL